MTTTERVFGASIQRLEDPRFITGQARYTHDLVQPGMVHMAVDVSQERILQKLIEVQHTLEDTSQRILLQLVWLTNAKYN